MNLKNISELFSTEFSRLNNEVIVKRVLNRANSLYGLDVINRILLSAQDKHAKDVRTAEEWQLAHRKLKKNAKGYDLILPVIETKYIDLKTGKEVEKDALTIQELNLAAQHKVVRRDDHVKSLYQAKLFDISDTLGKDKERVDKDCKPLLSIKRLFTLYEKVTSGKISIKCDKTYYDKEKDILYIHARSYDKIANIISKRLSMFLINCRITEEVEEALDISKESFLKDKEHLLENCLRFALCTLFRADANDIKIKGIKSRTCKEILDILNLVDVLLVDVVDKLEFKDTKHVPSSLKNIIGLKKADQLITLADALKVQNTMKGA